MRRGDIFGVAGDLLAGRRGGFGALLLVFAGGGARARARKRAAREIPPPRR
jgi:hypothetical protein